MSEREKIIARLLCDGLQGQCMFPACNCPDAKEDLATAISALESAGYVIAKREPDEAMIEAGSTARCYREDGERDGLTDDNTTATWRAMIAAQEQKP